MQNIFSTPTPPNLYVEIGSGDVTVDAADVQTTTVEVTGDQAEEVVVEQKGDTIVVVAPRRTGFFTSFKSLRVAVSVPQGASLTTKLGSADLVGHGRLGWVKVATGSGNVRLEDVDAEAVVKTGSGDISLHDVRGHAELKAGSGDITVGSIAGQAKLATGSGDIEIGRADREVSLKSGSGDLRLGSAATDAVLSTASGDLRVERFEQGQVTAKNVSGDIHLGILAGVPVWTDVTSTTGHVRSSLQGAGQPAEGQPYVEVRAKTVSGNVSLQESS